MTTEKTYCGHAVIAGRPNVGKSTLLNRVLDMHLAATTPKPQTTRNRILGIYTQDQHQLVFVDTPGIHDDGNRQLNRRLNKTAVGSLVEADVVLFMIEAGTWHDDDKRVLKFLQNVEVPVVLVVNKIDKIGKKETLLPFIESVSKHYPFAGIVPVSAFQRKDVDVLLRTLLDYMPENDFEFAADEITDRSMRFVSSELVREQLMHVLEKEAPYAVAVEIDDYQEEDNGIHINATIYVEREGQKRIVIGKKGAVLKVVGTEARKRISAVVGAPVHIKLWVKIKADWRENQNMLNRFVIDNPG